MPDHRPSIALQQVSIGDYRQAVLDLIHERCGSAFAIWCGGEYFDATTRTAVTYPGPMTVVDNRFLCGRRLVWQRELIRPLLAADVAIVELNPRILSNWLILAGRRLRRKPTVVWGHAWSRSGARSRTDVIRDAMRRLGNVILVYTERQKAELIAYRPGARVVAAPNALYRRTDILGSPAAEATDVLYAARLVAAKKPQMLVEAFLLAASGDLPADVRLILAGEGPERAAIERRCGAHPHGERVVLLGHVSPAEMRDRYAVSFVSVSPGYVGLSIVQSLSFGVPMIYMRDEQHCPEIEAAVDGFNARSLTPATPTALASVLVEFARERVAWGERRASIAEDCAQRYCADLMAERILEAAK
jgi:glycosyltransferase involved in cell wall biosynthesis